MKQNKIPRNEYIRKPVGKTNPYKEDTIYTDMGQWKYPGQVTKIPSGDITMQGVPYPVYGQDNLGYSQMMYPGMDYQFPGQYVTEYPMAAYGGDPSLPNIEGHYKTGGWLDKYQKGGASRADSLALYNNAIMLKAFYDKLKPYYKTPDINKFHDYDKNRIESGDVQKETLEYPDVTEANKNIIRANKDPNISYLSDIITGLIDPNAPLLRYDKRIKPQGSITYLPIDPLKDVIASKIKVDNKDVSETEYKRGKLQDMIEDYISGYKYSPELKKEYEKFIKDYNISDAAIRGLVKKTKDISSKLPGAATTIPYYDPLAVKPADMLTPEEKILREQKYGKKKSSVKPSMTKDKSGRPVGIIGQTSKMWSKKDVTEEYWNKFIKKYPGAIGLDPNNVDKDSMHSPIYPTPKNKEPEEVITPDYLPMIQTGMPDMISREPEIIASPTPRPSSTNNRISWRMDPETRKMVPVYLEGKTQKVKEGKRLYNKNIPSSTAAIPADFVPQFEPNENKDVVSKQMGGWLDAYDDEYRRGGQRRKKSTSKNVQSSINDVFRRNYDVFGPGGKRRYNPRSRYEEGGYLKHYQGDVEGSQVMPDEAVPGVNYFSLPEVTVKPKTWLQKVQESDFIKQIVDRLDKSTGGKDWYKDPSKGIGSALAEVVSLPFAAPQLAATYGVTGKVQTPSEAMDVENPFLAFGIDAILDPSNLLGAGLIDDVAKLPTKAGKAFGKKISNKTNDFGEAILKVKENMQRSPNNPFKKTLSATEMEELKNIRVAGSIADDMNISDIEKIESLLKQDVKDDVLIKLTGQNREELKNQLTDLRNPKSKSKTLSQELEPPLSEIDIDMSDLLSDMYSRSRDPSIGDYDIDRVSPMVSTGRRWEQIPITDDPDLNITIRQETNNPYTYSDPNYLTDASRFINERRFREGQTSDYITNIPPVLQRRMVDKVQEYPVINTHGYEPLINSLTKRSTANPAGAMRGAVKTVLGSPKGSKFIPSGSLSSDSYNMSLRAIPSLLDKKAVDVNFLGYNSMNTMGYLTKAGQSPNIIADEMNTIIKKLNKKLPRKEKIPYAVVKDDNVLYPGIGVTRKKMGGWLNKAQDGKEYSDAEANYLNRKAYEESLAQARKDYVNDFVKQGTQDALLNSPFNFIAGITPAGAGIFAGQSALSSGQNLANKEYFDAGLDALFAAPLLKGTKPAVKKVATKVLEKAPWRFKPQKGKIYRQVGKPGFEDAVKEKKVYDKGQKEFLENYPETNYLGEYNEATNAKGLYMKKPSPAPFFSKDQLFFPTNRKATGKGFKKTKNSDAEYLFEGNVPDEALLPRYMDSYLKPGTNSNIFVLRPEYNDLSNFNVYQRDWLRGYKPVKIPKQKMGGWLDKYNNF